MTSVSIDAKRLHKQLNKVMSGLSSAIDASVFRTAKEVASVAKRYHRYKTRGPNGLQKNTYAKKLGLFSAMIIADKPYASFVNFGTVAHKIYPKNTQFLRFKIGRKVIFAKEVNHPGTKPDPFMTDAATGASIMLPINMKMDLNDFFRTL